MVDLFSFADLYQFGSNLFDVLLGLQDFFFEPRSFSFSFSPVTDFILTQLGLSLNFAEGSIASWIIGFGLPSLLTFKLVKFLLDLLL